MTGLRSGYTTGTCASAAAKASVMLLLGEPVPHTVDITLPKGECVSIQVESVRIEESMAEATILKDAGDDPDITHGLPIIASACWIEDREVILEAGEGIGTVTKPGLQVKPGDPAINPIPAAMIRCAVRELTNRGVKITIRIPGGRELAAKTFNPRLGIVGGLSILGTTGRVRPFSCSAIRQTIVCCLEIANACEVTSPVLVPGHIGEKAARRHFRLQAEQVVEVSNEWGFTLDRIQNYHPSALLVLGHPGKMAKLSCGSFDTHSSRSSSALPYVLDLARNLLGQEFRDIPTVEGIFSDLENGNKEKLGDALAGDVQTAINSRLNTSLPIAVVLVDMKGDRLGAKGDLTPWKKI
jgi:cobalt-precorrin-5B (C1)-methyltransferase